jgi:alpha-L-fucosidase
MNRSVSPLLPLVLRSLLRSPIRILLLSALLLGMVPARAAESAAPPERLDWWREAAFGMFIHWGVYTIPGRGEWIMYQEHIPAEEYAALAEQFQPRDFNPREWVALAKASGMKYVVITTRHHDGYCLFDSQVSDFTSVKTGAKRDFIAEFVATCREADMRIGSLCADDRAGPCAGARTADELRQDRYSLVRHADPRGPGIVALRGAQRHGP